ncbi:MAG: hypothetical protein AB9907_09590 [Flexilinea sp.]
MTFLVVPVGVLFISAGSIWLLDKVKKNIGISWLIAVIAAIIVWIWTLYLHWIPNTSFQIGHSAFPGTDIPLLFTLDSVSWPYMMALASLFLVMMLTAPSRMDPETTAGRWIEYLLIVIIGLIAVASGGLWPVIFCWMVFDILDLLFLLSLSGKASFIELISTMTAIRLTGTFLAAVGLAVSMKDSGGTYQADLVSSAGGMIILIACALRLGIVPIHQSYMEMPKSQIGLGTVLRLVSVIMVLPVLCRIPLTSLSPVIAAALSVFAGFSALVCSLGWILSKNPVHRISYFTTAVASMSFACILRGQQQASIIWGVSVILTGAPIFLYIAHGRRLNVLLMINCLFFSGLAYMPNAAGWFGLIVYPLSLMDYLFFFVQVNLLAGLLIHIHSKGEFELNSLEPWMRTVYPFGFLLAIGSHLVIASFNWNFSSQQGIWWASGSASIIAIVIWLGSINLTIKARYTNLINWGQAGITVFLRGNQQFLELRWLFRLIEKVIKGMDKAVIFISEMIESPGGLLWEFLLLTAFILLILSGTRT